MDKQQLIQKTAKEAEPREVKEVSDESLEKVSGGVQPDPKDHDLMSPKGIAIHL